MPVGIIVTYDRATGRGIIRDGKKSVSFNWPFQSVKSGHLQVGDRVWYRTREGYLPVVMEMRLLPRAPYKALIALGVPRELVSRLGRLEAKEMVGRLGRGWKPPLSARRGGAGLRLIHTGQTRKPGSHRDNDGHN